MLSKILIIAYSILSLLSGILTTKIQEFNLEEMIKKVVEERTSFEKSQGFNKKVHYANPEKRKKIESALREKLGGFAASSQTMVLKDPEDLPEGANLVEQLTHTEEKYEYFWHLGEYKKASKLLDIFFKKVFEGNLKFSQIKANAEIKKKFLNVLTLFAKHHFYNMMHFKGSKQIISNKSSHLEAYVMFQVAAEMGSGEAYFYLSLMQTYGLDYFRDKDLDFDRIPNIRVEVTDYLKNRKDILANAYLYSSALSGSENAMIAMGNKYSYGIGVKKDCIASLAYKKDPAYNIATSNVIKPQLNRNYHLAKDIFNMNIDQNSSSNLRKRNEDKINLAREQADKGVSKAQKQLASIYLFGLYGQKIDYEKAFEHFNIAMNNNDLNSYHMVGTMYYYGLGVEKNLKKALEIFEKCSALNVSACFNALGLMYQRGEFVNQDILKAYSMYKKGSELGDSYAQFNRGALLLIENGYQLKTNLDERDKPDRHALVEHNIKQALHLFALSAHQHHLPSLYMLALIHMEGHEHYSSCTLSSSLLSQVLSRKNSQFYSNQVDKFFDGEILQPMMVFMEAAYLGRNDGIINAMALVDKYGSKHLGKSRFLREVIQGEKPTDGFTPPGDLVETDVKKVLRLFDLDNEAGMVHLEKNMFGDITRLIERNTPVYKNLTHNPGYQVATNLMLYGVKYEMTMAYVRLGDYYYYGKHPDGVNYQKAFGMYKTATWYNNSIDFQAQGYLSLGYMYQFGKGCKRDLEKARDAYTKARELGGKFSYFSYFTSLLLELDELMGVNIDKFSSFAMFKGFLKEKMIDSYKGLMLENQTPSAWLLGLLTFLVVTARAKLINQKKRLEAKKKDIAQMSTSRP